MVSASTMNGRRGAESNTRSEKSRPTRYTKTAAQDNLISYVGDGYTIKSALEKVGRSYKAYEQWRRDDPDFKKRVDQARSLQKGSKQRTEREKLDFATFRKKYLKTETFWHQHQWIDILEGRDPRDLHPAQIYRPAKKSRLLINVPPFHAKSMTITMDYVTYRLAMDPSFRVIIVSASSTLAEDFLFGIKQRLTHPDYLDLQLAYAPEGGYKQTAESWKQNRIVIGAADRDGAEKDPSVQAIGINSQIYGSRCDMVIVDDAVIGKNVNEYEKQMKWLRTEVSSRIEMGGKLLVIGTRMAPLDLYGELMNEDNYGSGKVPWTYFASPAILEEGSTPEEHVTLWPETDMPWQEVDSEDVCDCGRTVCIEGWVNENGEKRYPRWDGVHLEVGPRAENSVADWNLVYQQKSMHEDMVFPEYNVQKSINRSRAPGILRGGDDGHPNGGMHGHEIIAGCDPSVKGHAGIIILAFDRATGVRRLLNAIDMKAPTPKALKDEMKRVTDAYQVNEWRVEKTGLLQFFTQDEELRLWMAARGVRFSEHNTNASTKWDPAYGVASLSSLFGAYEHAGGEVKEIAPPLIELPIPMKGVRLLVNQLITWTPTLDPKKVPQDLLMALWFAEVRCRELTVRSNIQAKPVRLARFVSRNARKGRRTVSLSAARGF